MIKKETFYSLNELNRKFPKDKNSNSRSDALDITTIKRINDIVVNAGKSNQIKEFNPKLGILYYFDSDLYLEPPFVVEYNER